MSRFFDDTMQGLLQVVEIEKGSTPLVERDGMPAPTFYVPNDDEDLIDCIVKIRENENITQSGLAEMIGSRQQAISRLEKKEHQPSLKLFYSIVDALGYELIMVKKQNISQQVTVNNT